MKFDCGDTYDVYLAKQWQWHSFFAIFPRRVGPRECRWFETIERRRERRGTFSGCYWHTEYRAKS